MSNHVKNNSKYKFLWSNTQSLLTLQMNIQAFSEFSNALLSGANNVIEVSRDSRMYCYHSKQDLDFDAREGERVFGNKKLTKDFFLSAKKVQKNHKNLYKKLEKIKYAKLSNEELYDQYLLMIADWMCLMDYYRGTQAGQTNFLMDSILKQYSKEEASTLTLPLKIDPIDRELIDWQELLKNKYSKKKIGNHLLKHPWIAAAHFTFEDVEKTIRERFKYDKKNYSYKNITKKKKGLKNKQEALLRKKPKLREIIKKVQTLALNRIEIKACWAGMDYYLLPLTDEIAKRTGADQEVVGKYYLSKDLNELLLKNKKLSKKEIADRKKCFVGLWKDGKITYKSGITGEKLAKKELRGLYETKKEKIIKGMVANSGKIVARARILSSNNIEQLQALRKNFKKGDVLVTQMTQPNIMDIASRAGGIITDEGGMLSHAAIISRELGIPCVVGTSVATEIIKDGDLVEVDASRGVIKIIK